MSDEVKLALIGGFFSALVPTFTILMAWRSQRDAAKDAKELAALNKTEAIAARNAQNVKIDKVATSVDGHATAQESRINALHTEVARLQAPGTTTPATGSGAPVTMDKSGIQVTATDKHE